MKPLRLIAANDTFGVLNAMIKVLADECALFITPPELNGLMPEVHGLLDQVANQVALIIETSGSSGTPKRIELSRDALLASAEASAKRLGGHGQWLLALPLNYIAGANVLIRSVVAETQPVMMNTRVPFTAEGFLRACAHLSHVRKYTSLVPLQLSKLLEFSRQDSNALVALRSFNAILVGGQAPNWSVVSELRELGVSVVVSYGMTETSGGCVYDQLPLDGVQIEISKDRILVSGAVLANNLGDRYLTQDLGSFVDGRLEVWGRADRMIISGGLKVSLDQIEQSVTGRFGLSQVVAEGIKTEWGESVAIGYVADKDLDFSYLEKEYSVAHKPYKLLRLESFPTLISGKPDRLAIQSLLSN